VSASGSCPSTTRFLLSSFLCSSCSSPSPTLAPKPAVFSFARNHPHHVCYMHPQCAKCGPLYFKDAAADDSTCSKCDSACAKSCTGPSKLDCSKCASGWEMAEAEGCVDINECVTDAANCSEPGVYCSNTDGSYVCEKCDTACHPDDGCTGAGPKNCAEKSCADGHEFSEAAGCTGASCAPYIAPPGPRDSVGPISRFTQLFDATPCRY
jgi:hypothetical protein